jgi:hypothetical protein
MRISRALPTAAALLVAMLGLVACAADDTAGPGTGTPGSSSTTPPGARGTVGKLAFSGTTLDGKQTYSGKVGILGIAGLDDLPNMRPFVDRTKTGSITHLADPDGRIWQRFKVTQQSTYVLIDASGNVTFTGIIGGDELRSKVAALAG